jgi:hypothetical protein
MVTGNPVNPFQPPAPGADAVRPVASEGSLEKAINGEYDFEIGDVMSEAWRLTAGFKGTFWGAAIVAYFLMIAVFLIAQFVSTLVAGSDGGFVLSIVVNLLITAAVAPLFLGLLLLGIRRASGQDVSFGVVFGQFDKLAPAAGAYVLTTLLTYVGAIFLLLPGIYLALAYGMTLPLIADRNLPIWQAMETSRKALTHKWFRLFGLYLVVGLVVGLSALPLGIGLIWTGPWSIVIVGVLYRRIFGAASPAPAV